MRGKRNNRFLIEMIFLGLLMNPLISFCQVPTRDNLLLKARFLVAEHAYPEAVTALENHTIAATDQDQAALTLGQALAGIGQFSESNTWLSHVTGRCSALADYVMASNYLALNDVPSAMEYLSKHLANKEHYTKKKIQMDPVFAKLETDRSWIRLWQTEWYSELENQIAECDYMISQNDQESAQSLAGQILAAHPDDPHAPFILAKIQMLQKEERQSKQSLDRAWQLAGDHIGLMSEMAQFAMDQHWFEKANIMVSELIRKDPTNPQFLISRALIRLLDGSETAAILEFQSIEEIGIVPAELYYQAGQRLSSSSPVQAEKYLDKAVETGTLDARYYYARGQIRHTMEKTDLALDDFAMSLDINPKQPNLLLERAQIRFDKGDNEGACHDWQKALDMGNAKAADLLYKHCRLP